MIAAPAPVEAFDPGLLFRAVDIAGVVANGLLGGAVARARRFDLIGFLVLAIISGLGGGIIRDVMLGTGLPVALTDPWYLASAIAAAVLAYAVSFDGTWSRRGLIVADFLALGCWSATGAAKGLALGLDPLPCILLGTITAVGGGMVRDVLVGTVPAIFGGTPVYATFAVLGSAEMVLVGSLVSRDAGMAVAILSCLVLGLLARRRHWRLPGPIEPHLLGRAAQRRKTRPRKRIPRRVAERRKGAP